MSVVVQPLIPRTPFGLPTGSIRGVISILICAFFWVVLLWPHGHPARVVLAHFFLLGLVLMAFASHPLENDGESAPFLPWLLRLIFVGGSLGIVAIAWYQDPQELQERLTPEADEVRTWWIPYLACTFGGFFVALTVRFLMGKRNHVFMTLRAWLSVVAMVMLALEIAAVIALASSQDKSTEWLHYWDCVELAIVSAYFGTRA